MKSTNTRQRLERSLNSGWAIQIYDGKRQLRCALDPSHGWSLVAGAAVGGLLAVVGFNLSLPEPSQPLVDETILPMTAPLQVD